MASRLVVLTTITPPIGTDFIFENLAVFGERTFLIGQIAARTRFLFIRKIHEFLLDRKILKKGAAMTFRFLLLTAATFRIFIFPSLGFVCPFLGFSTKQALSEVAYSSLKPLVFRLKSLFTLHDPTILTLPILSLPPKLNIFAFSKGDRF